MAPAADAPATPQPPATPKQLRQLQQAQQKLARLTQQPPTTDLLSGTCDAWASDTHGGAR